MYPSFNVAPQWSSTSSNSHALVPFAKQSNLLVKHPTVQRPSLHYHWMEFALSNHHFLQPSYHWGPHQFSKPPLQSHPVLWCLSVRVWQNCSNPISPEIGLHWTQTSGMLSTSCAWATWSIPIHDNNIFSPVSSFCYRTNKPCKCNGYLIVTLQRHYVYVKHTHDRHFVHNDDENRKPTIRFLNLIDDAKCAPSLSAADVVDKVGAGLFKPLTSWIQRVLNKPYRLAKHISRGVLERDIEFHYPDLMKSWSCIVQMDYVRH